MTPRAACWCLHRECPRLGPQPLFFGGPGVFAPFVKVDSAGARVGGTPRTRSRCICSVLTIDVQEATVVQSAAYEHHQLAPEEPVCGCRHDLLLLDTDRECVSGVIQSTGPVVMGAPRGLKIVVTTPCRRCLIPLRCVGTQKGRPL